MAAEIGNYLKEHKKEIVNLVEEKGGHPENIRGPAFENLVTHLMLAFPLGRDNQPWRDKAHEELAITIIHSMWCGWLSKAKTNRGVYTAGEAEGYRSAIDSAFEIGQKYSEEKK
jgi:hypothetical protein